MREIDFLLSTNCTHLGGSHLKLIKTYGKEVTKFQKIAMFLLCSSLFFKFCKFSIWQEEVEELRTSLKIQKESSLQSHGS